MSFKWHQEIKLDRQYSDLFGELVDSNVGWSTDEHWAASQTWQMVDDRSRRHCFAGAWGTLDQTQRSLQHRLHCIHLHTPSPTFSTQNSRENVTCTLSPIPSVTQRSLTQNTGQNERGKQDKNKVHCCEEVNIRIFTLAVCNAVSDTGLMSAMHHSFAVFPWICIVQLSVGPPVARWLTRYQSARKMTSRTPFLQRCLSLINYSCGCGCFARGLKWAVVMIIAASLYRVPKANSKSNSGTSSHWSSKQGCILLDMCWKCC